MRIGEFILRALSRNPVDNGVAGGEDLRITGDELSLLRKEFPRFSELVRGKRVVDFGCGAGRQAIALALEEGCAVCGIDINSQALQKAEKLLGATALPPAAVSFVEEAGEETRGSFDVVLSLNAMEHYPEPEAILTEMKTLLNQNGKLLITFGPPWLAPYGSHMDFFCKVPWLNLLFSEQTVMRVRALYRDDGATRYQDVRYGLNKMTVARFEEMASQCGLRIEYCKYTCVRNIDWLGKLPGLRELFINHVSYLLTPSSTQIP
jgi:SAM-dependent methyltransferase